MIESGPCGHCKKMIDTRTGSLVIGHEYASADSASPCLPVTLLLHKSHLSRSKRICQRRSRRQTGMRMEHMPDAAGTPHYYLMTRRSPTSWTIPPSGMEYQWCRHSLAFDAHATWQVSPCTENPQATVDPVRKCSLPKTQGQPFVSRCFDFHRAKDEVGV